MQTKNLSMENVLIVTPKAAAVILIKDMQDGDEADWSIDMPEELKEAIRTRTPWEIISDHTLRVMVKNAGMENLMLILNPANWFCDEDFLYAYHFTGKAVYASGEAEYDDAPFLIFTPDNDGRCTAEDYKERLAPMFGEDFPFAQFIGTINGTAWE